jgi:hypothetical protein
MAQVPASGSEVSRVESDVSQTISLADSIVTLLREPVALLYQNITKAQELKRNLGHWQGEAIDGDKQCRIPVLRLKEFEKYLVDTDGRLLAQATITHPLKAVAKIFDPRQRFRKSWGLSWSQDTSPQSDNLFTAKACWAYLLHALGIRPGMGIVGWRPTNDGFISTQNGSIEMEIDGSVLCHIINLYSLPLDPSPYARSNDERIPNCADQKLCKLPFGRLAWEKANGQIHAHFEPGLEMELNAEKIPFGAVGSLLEPNTWAATYFTALMHGVSDPELRLVDPTVPLTERIESFLYCLKMLRSFPRKPRVISYAWFEEAARIKRRLLAQGGKDHSFFTDICDAIDKEPLYYTQDREDVKDRVRALFLLDTESFTFWAPSERTESDDRLEKSPEELVRETLDGYEHQRPGTWKYDLYCMRGNVMDVLRTSNEVFLNSDTWLMEFTSGCPLWNERVLFGAPSVH